MPVGERESLTGLISMLLVMILFAWRLNGLHAAGAFDGADALQVWARAVLILIGVSIGIAIVVHVAVHLLLSVLTGDDLDERRDERDHLIERRALTWGWYLLSFGILGIVVDLALGASGLRALNLMIALCAGSEALKDAVKLWLYRREA
ncbi:MAG: hypothetical protein R3D60_08870 [Paracoccaceae bacterium]